MMIAPETTLTFLFTEVAGSARLWEADPKAMDAALVRHDAILRGAIEAAGGRVFKTVGEAFFASFASTPAAVDAAIRAQCALEAEDWGAIGVMPVRMAIHTGAVESRDGDYFGRPLNRLARLLSLAQGGQVLLSEAAHVLAASVKRPDVAYRDLGSHLLRGFEREERVTQLLARGLRAEFAPSRASSRVGSLPRQLSRFIGRETEAQEVVDLLRRTRVLTLTGAGGTGKTRLAIWVAEAVRSGYPDGAWLVELAGIPSGVAVESAILGTLGIRETPGLTPDASLVRGLGEFEALIVLDNCEHVLDSVAKTIGSLLQSCPRVRFLTTSREHLAIPGEVVYPVPALAIPLPGSDTEHERLSEFASVRLFVDRATNAEPKFLLSAANGAAVARICRDLDGMPLALELAASRVRALPVEKIAERLGDRFRFLSSGARTADRRQQTLRGLIDWSYDLLKPDEQALLRALPAFVGGWTLDALEALGPAMCPEIESWAVLDLLHSLVDKSLVVVDDARGRYRLLETVRRYAWERATEKGEIDRLRQAHASSYGRWTTGVSPGLAGREQIEIASLIESEHDNLRSALDFRIENAQAGAAQRLVADLADFWEFRGFLSEGVARGRAALSLGSSESRLAALLGTGRLLILHAESSAQATFLEALDLARACGDRRAEADALHGGANWAFFQKRIDEAEEAYERAAAIRRELGDRRGVASSAHSLGNVRLRQDRLFEAERLFDEALSLRRALGDVRGETLSIGALSQLALMREDYPAVERLSKDVARRISDLGMRWALAICLSSLIAVARHRGDLHRAVTLAGSRARVRETTGFPLPTMERNQEAENLEELRLSMGEKDYEAAFKDGYAQNWDEAVTMALDEVA